VPLSAGLAVTLGVLLVVNLLNNRFAPRAYLATSVLATGALLALAHGAGLTWADVGLVVDRRGALWGLAGAAAIAAGHLLAARLPVTRPAYADARFDGADGRQAAYQILVRIPLGTVLLEEVAFRGVLYGLVAAARGPVTATVVSSVLFGLWHVLPALALIRLNRLAGRTLGGRGVLAAAVAALATMVAGVVLGELRRHGGGLVAPAAVHWAANGFGFLLARADDPDGSLPHFDAR